MSARPAPIPIPVFQLYGEGDAPDSAEAAFVHIETIGARAGLHDWEIRPHRHADLCQCLLILKGGGRISVDGAEQPFAAPALLAVPSSLVHAFAFEPDTEGYVLTLSDAFVTQVLAAGPEPMPAPAWPLATAIASDRDRVSLAGAFEGLSAEFHWPRPGRYLAIRAYVVLILLAADLLTAGQGAPRNRDAVLVDALRALIHRQASQGWGVRDYARALSVTPSRLTTACRRIAGRSPIQLAHDQLMEEAKRNLIYTGMTVKAIGYALGFSDPAYFSRFFTRRQGVSPYWFRTLRGRATPG